MSDQSMAALGRIPSGLFVLTVSAGGRETGMLASWIQQCSFDPPRVSVAVAKERWVLPELTEGAAFTVNVLPEGEKKLVAHFGKGFTPDQPAFDGIDVTRTADGAPVLTAAHAYVACRVAARFDAGDHVLVVGTVVGGAVQSDARPATHVRRSGAHYKKRAEDRRQRADAAAPSCDLLYVFCPLPSSANGPDHLPRHPPRAAPAAAAGADAQVAGAARRPGAAVRPGGVGSHRLPDPAGG